MRHRSHKLPRLPLWLRAAMDATGGRGRNEQPGRKGRSAPL